MNQPIVTVLLPVKNGQEFIKNAIDSILSQSFTNFELVIIENGSKNKNNNSIFHSSVLNALGGIGIGIFFLSVGFLGARQLLWFFILFSTGLIFGSFAMITPRLKPYSEFHTRKQSKLNRIFNFFVIGLITYLVFTVGAGLMKDIIIKYVTQH